MVSHQQRGRKDFGWPLQQMMGPVIQAVTGATPKNKQQSGVRKAKPPGLRYVDSSISGMSISLPDGFEFPMSKQEAKQYVVVCICVKAKPHVFVCSYNIGHILERLDYIDVALW